MADDDAATIRQLHQSSALETWRCNADDHDGPLNWWCWRFATLLGQIGNEEYYRCGQCSEIFRTGAT